MVVDKIAHRNNRNSPPTSTIVPWVENFAEETTLTFAPIIFCSNHMYVYTYQNNQSFINKTGVFVNCFPHKVVIYYHLQNLLGVVVEPKDLLGRRRVKSV